MGVKQLHTAVCTCDGCGVCTDAPYDLGDSLVECLPAGWYLLDVKVQYRTDCGYNSAPSECLTVCSKACAGRALNARLKHA